MLLEDAEKHGYANRLRVGLHRLPNRWVSLAHNAVNSRYHASLEEPVQIAQAKGTLQSRHWKEKLDTFILHYAEAVVVSHLKCFVFDDEVRCRRSPG